jgi:hypothetical protein
MIYGYVWLNASLSLDQLISIKKIEVSKHDSNETIVELIPQKTLRIAFFETLKTDLDRLIYNCG